MTLHEHVARLVSACFYQLRRIRSFRRSIPTSTAVQLLNSFIISQVDYCNSQLSGAQACLTDRVQSVLNAAARVIYGRWRYDHVTDLIRNRLLWLPVCQRTRFKCSLLAYNGLHGFVPSYISDFCVRRTRPRTDILYKLEYPRVTNWSCRKQTQFEEGSFVVSGQKIWNSLPNNVKNAICRNF